jgi:hypothetical protein
MKNIVAYISISAMLFLSSCMDFVDDFDLNDVTPRIVANAQFQPDSLIRFNLYKSTSRNNTGDGYFFLRPDVLNFYIDGQLQTLEKKGRAEYIVPNRIAQYGEKYAIEVQASGLKTATADVDMPDTVPFVIHSYEVTTRKPFDCPDCEERKYVRFRIDINDPEGDNFYAISANELFKAEGFYNDSLIYTTYNYSIVSFESNDGLYEFYYSWGLEINNDPTASVFGSKLFFSDNLFKGKTRSLLLDVDITYMPYYYNYNGFPLSDSKPLPLNEKKYVFKLTTYSRSLYNYYRSVANYNTVGDFFLAEPVLLNSNVENGTGVLGASAFSTKEYTIILPTE